MMDIKSKFLDEILNCPDIKWKILAEVAEIGTGSRNTNEAIDDGQYTFFVRSQKSLLINEYEFDETAIITAGDGVGVGKVFHFVVGKYALHQRAYRICVTNLELCPKFLFYYIKTYFYDYLMKVSVHASVTSLRKPMFEKYLIPIPPLPIQQKIVDILDTFTTLTAELTAELTARKQQYEYYRDELLTFGDDVEWKPLGSIGTVIRGNGLQKKNFLDEGFPAIHYGQLHTHFGLSAHKTYTYVSKELASKLRKASNNDLLIVTTSEDDDGVAKPLAWLGEDVAISGDMMMFKHNENVKFLAYVFQTNNFKGQKNRYVNGAKVRRISKDNLEKIEVPVPSLNEQSRIVEILDKFDALTNSITEGLPREIKLRQQQYEYYRGLLLSFPKPEEVR